MATHFSILAWEIPRTEKPGWLQSMGSQRIRHDPTQQFEGGQEIGSVTSLLWFGEVNRIARGAQLGVEARSQTSPLCPTLLPG